MCVCVCLVCVCVCVYTISETKKKDKGIIPCNDYIFQFYGEYKDKRCRESVGILIHKKFKRSILNYSSVSERIIVLGLKIKKMGS